jgi:hypothetical protein
MELGHASGWKIEPDQEAGVWRWSVFTLKGSRSGTGTSPENCGTQVDQALHELGSFGVPDLSDVEWGRPRRPSLPKVRRTYPGEAGLVVEFEGDPE